MNEFLLYQLAAFSEAQRHDRSYKIGSGDYRRTDIRLLDMVDKRDVRQPRRVVDLAYIPFFVIHFIGNVRHGGNHLHVEFTAQPFLDYFHMEQPQESATEPETQRHRRFRLECQRRIVKLQFLKR